MSLEIEYDKIVKNLSKNNISSYVCNPCQEKDLDLPMIIAGILLKQNKDSNSQIMFVKSDDLSTMLAYNIAKNKQDSKSIGHCISSSEQYESERLNGDKNSTPIVYISRDSVNRIIIDLLDKYNKSEISDLFWCNILIVDNAYCNEIESKLLLYLWRECYNTGKPVPRLLLLSTFEDHCNFLPSYPQLVHKKEPKNETIYTKCTLEANDGQRYLDLANIVSSFHENNPLAYDQTDIWVIFLPSINEIFKVYDVLFNKIKIFDRSTVDKNVGNVKRNDLVHQVEIIKFWDSAKHSNIKIFKDKEIRGIRRIILTTDKANGYFFGATIVFDCMTYIKEGSYLPRFISKRRADIRKSHASVLLVRHISEEFYNDSLAEGDIINMYNAGLAQLSIFLLSNGIDYNDFFAQIGVDSKLINNNEKQLMRYNLSSYDPTLKKNVINKVGKFIYNTKLGIKEGLVLHNLLTNNKILDKNLIKFVALSVCLSNPIVNKINDNNIKLIPDGYLANDVALNLGAFLYVFNSNPASRVDLKTLCINLNINMDKYLEVKSMVDEMLVIITKDHKPLLKNVTTMLSDFSAQSTLMSFDKICQKFYDRVLSVDERPGFYALGRKIVRWSPKNIDVITKKSGGEDIKTAGQFPKELFVLKTALMRSANNHVREIINYSYVTAFV